MIEESATRLLDQETLSLWISDTGNRIEPHLLEKVSEPYFTTKPVFEGTRVGLHFSIYSGDELPMPVSAA